MKEGKAILNGCANSLTGAGPRVRAFHDGPPGGVRQGMEDVVQDVFLVRHLP